MVAPVRARMPTGAGGWGVMVTGGEGAGVMLLVECVLSVTVGAWIFRRIMVMDTVLF